MFYEKELLNEMRIVVLSVNSEEMPRLATDTHMIMAMTINENMKSYGYCLRPNDIYKLATCFESDMQHFYNSFINMMDDVKAYPMYPNFPTQVMNLDEAQFRMHQMIHYFSTYGVEELFGGMVRRGWLPDVESTEKIREDETLLELKVLELIDNKDMYEFPMRKILTKKERMTIPEKEILQEALHYVDLMAVKDVDIPFKENIQDVFTMVANDFDPTEARPILRSICKHSGDVWRCLSGYLIDHDYRLTTSEKKLMVKLLEDFPIEDFEANLYMSSSKGSAIIKKLEFLSFNRFSRSIEHKEAVRKLRNSELQSWNGRVEYLLKNDMFGALHFISERPGMLVRLAARLIRLGVDPEDISKLLNEKAGSLSMQTLITLLNYFSLPPIRETREDAMDIFKIMYSSLRSKMMTLDTPVKNKKVYISYGDYDFEHSFIDMTKSSEGGYIRSGIAYKIPDEANIVRFFVYWNDKNRIDIDLHARGILSNGDKIHIGWNGDYNSHTIIHSGDITHSDAAEFIDVDLERTDAKSVVLDITSYTRVPFCNIDECYTGMLAVKEIGEEVKLYNPKNCFFSHNLRSNARNVFYGKIDVDNRILVLHAKETDALYGDARNLTMESPTFTLENYLTTLLQSQNANRVYDKDEADIVLKLDKPIEENEISIVDSNFFCD